MTFDANIMLKINQLKLTCLLFTICTVLLLVPFINTQPIRSTNSSSLYEHLTYAAINPNKADWPSLARLPGIGESKAKAIVYYRNQTDAPLFQTALDLTAIKGIGKITVQNIAPYLTFQEEK
jgi:competence ComEA-like helix-hairpin-helix protein